MDSKDHGNRLNKLLMFMLDLKQNITEAKPTKDENKLIQEFTEVVTVMTRFEIMRAVWAKTNEIIILKSTPSSTGLTSTTILCSPIQEEPSSQKLSIVF